MTNYEWLLNMGGEERQAWFDAQHVDANDTLSAENDVSVADMDANDVDVDSREMRVVFPRHNGEKQAKLLVKQFKQLIHGELHDSREKLEADVVHECAQPGFGPEFGEIMAWLDRQAAITEREVLAHPDERDEQIAELTAERDEWKAKAEQAERAMNAAAGKWARADDENRELRKMLLLDDGTVKEYTERADPLTALAYQKQLAEEWRDRCHNAEAWCDKLESERDELQRDLDIANAKLAGKPECEICDRATLLEEVEGLTAERDELKAFSGLLETAAHDKLGVTLFGVDYVTEDFMLHVRDTLTAERDYWKLHTDCWADKYRDMRTSRDCFRERAKCNEDKAKNYQRQLSKAERYGTIWPRWEDGAPIELPCAFEYMGNTERLQGIRFYSNAYVLEFTGIDHAKESFGIEYGTRHSRPPLIASDGKPILKGETLYGLSDSKAWTVTGFDRTRPWSVWAENGGGCKCLKPEWLAHEKPADGARAEKMAALEAENAELREKLGEAIGHAHEIGKLGDLEARAG